MVSTVPDARLRAWVLSTGSDGGRFVIQSFLTRSPYLRTSGAGVFGRQQRLRPSGSMVTVDEKDRVRGYYDRPTAEQSWLLIQQPTDEGDNNGDRCNLN